MGLSLKWVLSFSFWVMLPILATPTVLVVTYDAFGLRVNFYRIREGAP